MQEQTKALIAQLREAWGKTTKGEWFHDERNDYIGVYTDFKNGIRGFDIGPFPHSADAKCVYIAMRHMPQLLNALEDAERRAEAGERLAKAVSSMDGQPTANITIVAGQSVRPQDVYWYTQKNIALSAYDSAISPMGNDKEVT